MARKQCVEDIIVECNLSSCGPKGKGSQVASGTMDFLRKQGWRKIVKCDSNEPPKERKEPTRRTHLGFCPGCAKKYGVQE